MVSLVTAPERGVRPRVADGLPAALSPLALAVPRGLAPVVEEPVDVVAHGDVDQEHQRGERERGCRGAAEDDDEEDEEDRGAERAPAQRAAPAGNSLALLPELLLGSRASLLAAPRPPRPAAPVDAPALGPAVLPASAPGGSRHPGNLKPDLAVRPSWPPCHIYNKCQVYDKCDREGAEGTNHSIRSRRAPVGRPPPGRGRRGQWRVQRSLLATRPPATAPLGSPQRWSEPRGLQPTPGPWGSRGSR